MFFAKKISVFFLFFQIFFKFFSFFFIFFHFFQFFLVLFLNLKLSEVLRKRKIEDVFKAFKTELKIEKQPLINLSSPQNIQQFEKKNVKKNN